MALPIAKDEDASMDRRVQPRRANATTMKRGQTVPLDPQAPNEGKILAQDEELTEKRRQADLLSEELGTEKVALACGFPRPEVWVKLPAHGTRSASEIWKKHATAYSAGLLQGVRRAIVRLKAWFEANDLQDVCSLDMCEGGVC